MAIAEISITPMVEGEIGEYVDAAIDVIRASGLKHEVEAMSTTVEGSIDEIFRVVKDAHMAAKRQGAERVMTELRLDDKQGISIGEEVEQYRSSV